MIAAILSAAQHVCVCLYIYIKLIRMYSELDWGCDKCSIILATSCHFHSPVIVLFHPSLFTCSQTLSMLVFPLIPLVSFDLCFAHDNWHFGG